MIKEQNAAEYESARGGLRKAGLLNQEKDNPRQQNRGPRGKGSGKDDLQSNPREVPGLRVAVARAKLS